MSELNITLDGGTSKRLLTGGKFCDKDILVTANASAPEGIPEEAFTRTGDCQYAFHGGHWDWFIEQYGDKITTKDINLANYMFNYTKVKKIPFVINMKQDYAKVGDLLANAVNLTTTPTIKLNLVNPSYSNVDFGGALSYCNRIRDAENMFDPDDLEALSNMKVTSSYSSPSYDGIFKYCYSLRKIPSWWYKLGISEESTTYPSSGYCLYNNAVNYCYTLDELLNIPVVATQGAATSNMFSYSFDNCNHLKELTFEANADGTPKIVKWKSQTIDLSKNVGWTSTKTNFTLYNSGITADKEVKDDETYQALKNDPDWFATKIDYCRYNHDSAVATINSLPDTSAYLASAGGTNTIKFKGAAGAATDGGAINTLTEEEIAVATAKGWTVTLV